MERYTDPAEARRLRRSEKELQQTLRELRSRRQNGPSGTDPLQLSLEQALKDVRSYLSARDRDGKARRNQGTQNQTVRQPAQALAHRLQRTTDLQQWKQDKQVRRQEKPQTEDPNYRSLMQDQLTSRESLYALTRKASWTEQDRSFIRREVASMVARQKLILAHQQTDAVSSALWSHYTAAEDLVPKISSAIQDDAVILGAVDRMTPDDLTRFLNGKGEQALNQAHMRRLAAARTAAEAGTARQIRRKKPENERRKQPPVMG